MQLTIGIPTRNQSNNFASTLNSILSQINDENKNNIAVLILDDSDDDLTYGIVNQINSPLVEYRRGEKKGLDYADFWLIENARSEYVWLFGDDILLPGAINSILNILKLDPDFVWINSASNHKTKNFGESSWMSGSQVIEQIGDLLTFISALLWKRSVLIPHLNLGEDYLGNCMAYMYPQLEVLSGEGRFYYCDDVLFYSHARDFSKLWYNPFEVFAKNYIEALSAFKSRPTISRAVKKEIVRRGVEILKGVIYYHMTGKKYGLGMTTRSDAIKVFYKLPQTYVYLLFFLMPSPLLERLGSLIGKSDEIS
jgi:glycosyltransferase involved in cell wall biosynthesis